MNSDYILSLLKNLMKERKLTYKTLAQELELTEAGVKKMFQSGDASLSRVIAICDVLGIGLENLIELAVHRPIEEIEFNHSQQEFFNNNPAYFFFYLKLVYEGECAEKIKQEFRLSDKSVWKYLKKLDDLNLIKLEKGNKTSFRFSQLKGIKTKGRIFEKMKSDLAISFVRRIYESNAPERNRVMMSVYNLPEKSAATLRQEMLDLILTYQRKSEMERTNFKNTDLKKVSVLLGVADFSFISGVEEL